MEEVVDLYVYTLVRFSGFRLHIELCNTPVDSFYSARNARIASAVLATAILSVCLSVRPSVHHTPVLCQNDGT